MIWEVWLPHFNSWKNWKQNTGSTIKDSVIPLTYFYLLFFMFFDKKLIHFCLFLGLTNNFCRCWHRYDLKWKLCSWYSTASLSSFQWFFPGKFEILCLRLSTPSHLWSCTFCRLSKLLLQINHWGRHKSTREIARKWFQQQKLPICILQCCSLVFYTA